MAVELALTADSRWDISTEDLVEAARQAGFSALGIGADRVDATTAKAFKAAGLRCHELLALVLEDDEPAMLRWAGQLAEAAAVIDAQWVLTVFRCGLTDSIARVIEQCAGLFAEAGAGMAVEFSPLGPVMSIEAGLEIVRVAGPEQAGLLIDSWHFSFGDSTWDDLARVPLDQIAYLQFDDAPALDSDDLMEETMERRLMPGDGILELDRFAATLLGRGWEGLVSVEVLNRELLTLPVPEFARRAHDAAARFWL
jgi:sugar phosphate isomerase/epimerase